MSRSKNSLKCYDIRKGFVDNMRVPVKFYVNDKLEGLIFDELKLTREYAKEIEEHVRQEV